MAKAKAKKDLTKPTTKLTNCHKQKKRKPPKFLSLVEQMKQAFDEYCARTTPEERFQNLVDLGIIDENGQVLIEED